MTKAALSKSSVTDPEQRALDHIPEFDYEDYHADEWRHITRHLEARLVYDDIGRRVELAVSVNGKPRTLCLRAAELTRLQPILEQYWQA